MSSVMTGNTAVREKDVVAGRGPSFDDGRPSRDGSSKQLPSDGGVDDNLSGNHSGLLVVFDKVRTQVENEG